MLLARVTPISRQKAFRMSAVKPLRFSPASVHRRGSSQPRTAYAIYDIIQSKPQQCHQAFKFLEISQTKKGSKFAKSYLGLHELQDLALGHHGVGQAQAGELIDGRPP